MTAPNHALLVTLLAVFTACVGYAVGRLHQWYRTGLDRDEAYRDGYETATRSVFSTAARLIAPRRSVRGTASVTPVPAAPVSDEAASVPASRTVISCTTAARSDPPAASTSASPSSSPAASSSSAATLDEDAPGGRHLVPDELVQAPTYRLAPDRVARAKVREIAAEDEGQETTTRLPSVPRPRSS